MEASVKFNDAPTEPNVRLNKCGQPIPDSEQTSVTVATVAEPDKCDLLTNPNYDGRNEQPNLGGSRPLERSSLLDKLMAGMVPDVRDRAKRYVMQKEIPMLFQAILVGLLHHRPQNAIQFMKDCLAYVKARPEVTVRWDTFASWSPPTHDEAAPTRAPVEFCTRSGCY